LLCDGERIESGIEERDGMDNGFEAKVSCIPGGLQPCNATFSHFPRDLVISMPDLEDVDSSIVLEGKLVEWVLVEGGMVFIGGDLGDVRVMSSDG
jgi:hypothetical protein